MVKYVLAALALVSINAFAQDYRDTQQTQRLVIKCHGHYDKFSVFLEGSAPMSQPSKIDASLELGYVVKTWRAVKYDYAEDTKVEGAEFALEGAISGGKGNYNINVPWASLKEKVGTFTTSITLKSYLLSGKFNIECDTAIKTTKTKDSTTVTSLNY